MKLKYVGLKDSETAFSDVTGIIWGQGSEHDVSDEIAEKMLKHPDVFAVAEAATAEKAQEPVAVNVEQTPTMTREALALIDLENTSVEALRDYAKKAGLKVHHNAGEAKVREALTAFIKGE